MARVIFRVWRTELMRRLRSWREEPLPRGGLQHPDDEHWVSAVIGS